jgi:hypothetical protein
MDLGSRGTLVLVGMLWLTAVTVCVVLLWGNKSGTRRRR